VYGPHHYPEKTIPKFIMLAKNGMEIPIHGDGLATHYMHVYDATSAIDAILHKGETKGMNNIGAHEERQGKTLQSLDSRLRQVHTKLCDHVTRKSSAGLIVKPASKRISR
jgi:dTDP-D-glucose 4,6-dehydratase